MMNCFVAITSIVAFHVSSIRFEHLPDGYELYPALPLAYLVIYIIGFSNRRIARSSSPITIVFYLGIQWLRLVAAPTSLAIAGGSGLTDFLAPRPESVRVACGLILIEAIVTGIIVSIMARRESTPIATGTLRLAGSRLVYGVFIGASLAAFMLYAELRPVLNFLMIQPATGDRAGDTTVTIAMLMQQGIVLSFFIAFMWALDIAIRSRSRLAFGIAVAVGLANVFLLVGERRSAQVYAGGCAAWATVRAFPKKKKFIIGLIGSAILLTVSIMSIYKVGGAFASSSYSAALQESSFDIADLSRTLQSYFAGPEDLATIIDLASAGVFASNSIVFDFLRSIFPVNFLVRDDGELTSVIFNSFIYSGTQTSGHVVSSLAHGYVHMGPMLAVVPSILNLWIATLCERLMRRSLTLEWNYVWGYLTMRFAMNWTANTPALLSSSTVLIFTGGLLFVAADLANISKRWKERHEGTSDFVRRLRV